MDFESVKRKIAYWEDTIPEMYRGPEGKVTVGIGHRVPSVEVAKNLGLVYARDQVVEVKGVRTVVAKKGDAASAAAIAADYKKAQAKKGDLVLPQKIIDDLFLKDLKDREGMLVRRFPQFSTFPPAAQWGLLDIMFNVGETNFDTQFKKFKKAVEARDWETAAKESHRVIKDGAGKVIVGGKFEERNRWTAANFRFAAAEELMNEGLYGSLKSRLRTNSSYPLVSPLRVQPKDLSPLDPLYPFFSPIRPRGYSR